MGICNSCESTDVATTKVVVILHDGRVQEFSYPVRVSQVLERNPRSFVCNMDAMDIDCFLSAIKGDEMLLPGRLYFALPASWLKTRLSGEKMVSLAAKASLGLKSMGGNYGGKCYGGCGARKCDLLLDFSTEVSDSGTPVIVAGGCVRGGGSGGPTVARRAGGGGRRRFTLELNVILEEQGDDQSID